MDFRVKACGALRRCRPAPRRGVAGGRGAPPCGRAARGECPGGRWREPWSGEDRPPGTRPGQATARRSAGRGRGGVRPARVDPEVRRHACPGCSRPCSHSPILSARGEHFDVPKGSPGREAPSAGPPRDRAFRGVKHLGQRLRSPVLHRREGGRSEVFDTRSEVFDTSESPVFSGDCDQLFGHARRAPGPTRL